MNSLACENERVPSCFGPSRRLPGGWRCLTGEGLAAGDLRPFDGVGARVERVENGELRVLDNQSGVVDGVGSVLLGPVRVGGCSLGV